MKDERTHRASRVMTREEVRGVDRWAIEEMGISGVVLMENAGRSCAELIRAKLSDLDSPMVCIFCGTGNNGGDGYVIARHLLNAGFEVSIFICGDRQKVRGDAKANLDVLEKLGYAVGQIHPSGPKVAAQITAATARADMVVDALFGTGLQGPLREDYRTLVDAINAAGRPILAVDIPSGLDCDTGQPLGTAVKATYTVSFVAVKRGFLASEEAKNYIGELHVASIGVEPPV